MIMIGWSGEDERREIAGRRRGGVDGGRFATRLLLAAMLLATGASEVI